ncbi:MAG: ROK family protein [Pyrinomonadaceae bacterium]
MKKVGIEFRKNTIRTVCVDENEAVIRLKPRNLSADEDLIPQITAHIDNLKLEVGKVFTLGIAIPGLVNKRTNRIHYSARIPEYASIDISKQFEDALGVGVIVENDASAAAFGEYKVGAGKGKDNLFYIYLGSGVGGGLIFNGEIWSGDSGYSGEFGSFVIDSNGTRLEEMVSSQNIVRRTKARLHQDPTSSLHSIGDENITLGDIVREAVNEDDFAQLMLSRTGLFVGTALANVINLLNVGTIVIDGLATEAGDLILDPIRDIAKKYSFQPSYDTVTIVRGKLGIDAAAIGAALLSER